MTSSAPDAPRTRSPLQRLVLGLAIFGVGWLPVVVGALRTDTVPYWGGLLALAALYVGLLNGRAELLLAVGALSGSIVGVDTFARFALQDTLYYRPSERFIERWAPMPKLARFRPNVRFSGSSSGDIAAISGRRNASHLHTITFDTDRLGFRNEPSWIDAPVDVILVGDSFGAGTAVGQEEMLASLLRRDHGIAVYNTAIPFFGPWEELLTLKATYPELRTAPGARVLWLLFTGNDLDDRFEPSLEVDWHSSTLDHALVAYRSFRRRSPVRQLLDRLALRFGVVDLRDSARVGRLPNGGEMLYLRSYDAKALRSARGVRAHRNYAALTAVFDEMARFTRERDLGVWVVVVPCSREIYPPDGAVEDADPRPSGFAEVAGELAHERGFTFLDLEPALRTRAARAGYAPGSLLYWEDDTHWSPAGHAAAAAALVDAGLGHTDQAPEAETRRVSHP